ncbi:hypothetical protein GCM10027286_20400 [Virgibacillus ainsalahensis]
MSKAAESLNKNIVKLSFRGITIKSILKFWIAWVFGVIAAEFTLSLWRNTEVDWESIEQ